MVQSRTVDRVNVCEQYRGLVSKYDWDINIALAIMKAENRSCDPNADNTGLNEDGTNDVGLMQVNSIHMKSKDGRKDPETNIRLAYGIYKQRATWDSTGWAAWSTYNNKEYLNYIR